MGKVEGGLGCRQMVDRDDPPAGVPVSRIVREVRYRSAGTASSDSISRAPGTEDMNWITDPQAWAAFATLTGLEIVLGVDNVVFISILAGKLPAAQQERARKWGLGLAMIMRILLLLSVSWVVGLTAPLFTVLRQEISGRDLILIGGGLFLLGKSTHEMHDRLEGDEGAGSARVAASFGAVLAQIMLLDIVFSLDSVITAIGMADELSVMISAVVVSVGFMFIFAGRISRFVDRHPTVKVLALSFLLLIGATLVAEGFDVHVPKGYIYFAMAFSLFVEMFNLRARKSSQAPVHLRAAYRAGVAAPVADPVADSVAVAAEPPRPATKS
jgi:predicted tellurium resistance membrane protein TerC